MPLLTNKSPEGLGYELEDIQSKVNLKRFVIDKGSKAKTYYPDFILNIDGVPSVVIEAKKPGEDLYEAIRQASLYATEINKLYQNNFNPCKYIIATDGNGLLAGYWDEGKELYNIPFDRWLISDEGFSSFSQNFSKNTISKEIQDFKKSLRANVAYKQPISLLGGKFVKNQQLNNAFGETISIQYQHLFNPNEETQRADIVKNAYVKVKKHQSHVDPIDRLIRKKIRPSLRESKEIDFNSNEIVKAFENASNYNNQVILLIGSVGSGKSTFSTYLKEVALDEKILGSTSWVRLNLNNAPVSPVEIYNWVKNEIINQLKEEYKEEYNFYSKDFIEHLYYDEIKKFKEGIISLLNPSSEVYLSKYVDELLSYQKNIDLTLTAFIRTLVHNKLKNLIVVLDNCDKRNLEEQLLMFEVANWIKDNIKAIVFLPLRDTTYDNFRNQKPLDTVIKDLTFRINPPTLKKVLFERIKYASRLSEQNNSGKYLLPNGWKVSYPSQDELKYLRAILNSLFNNKFFKRLISGLAGRDIRKGIEIFMDFCKSGHITEYDILNIKRSDGSYELKNHVISQVFIRGNRKYYSDDESRIKNLFHSKSNDNIPDPFIRIAVLDWLKENIKVQGKNGIIGYHKVSDVLSTMNRLGHESIQVMEELGNLLKFGLIISESQEIHNLKKDDLITISIPGETHLELISNIDYLSACAEDVWYNKATIADEIMKNISGMGNYSHLSIHNNIDHSNILLNYMSTYYETYFSVNDNYLNDESSNIVQNFKKIQDNILSFEERILPERHKELQVGTIHRGSIVKVLEFGIIIDIDNCPKDGMVHMKHLNENFEDDFEVGDTISIKIKQYQRNKGKYDLLLND